MDHDAVRFQASIRHILASVGHPAIPCPCRPRLTLAGLAISVDRLA